MFRALLPLALLASPVHAQTAGDCIGIPDGLAWLADNGFHDMGSGTVEVGRVAIYARPDGVFFLVLFGEGLACIKAQGTGWTVGPNA